MTDDVRPASEHAEDHAEQPQQETKAEESAVESRKTTPQNEGHNVEGAIKAEPVL